MPSDSVKKSSFEEAKKFHKKSSYGFFVQEIPMLMETRLGMQDKVPQSLNQRGLANLLQARKSTREFVTRLCTKSQLLDVLWAGYGRLTAYPEVEHRTVPSAGGLYPLHLCVYAMNVQGLEKGFYHYSNGDLSVISGPEIDSICHHFHTKHINYEKAAFVIFIVGDLGLVGGKYGERGYRYMLLETGHVAQNMCLACVCLDIQHISVGGFDDDSVNELLCSYQQDFLCLYTLVGG